jgi:nitroreductase
VTSNNATAIEVLERLSRERHSCRAFGPGEVPRSTIERILEVAQRTASDCNTQAWNILVVGGSLLERLRQSMYERAAAGMPQVFDIAPIAEYRGVYRERRRACGWALYGAVGVQKGDRVASGRQALENFRFFGAPHLAVVTTDAALGARALLDCGGWITSFLLAAEALGVGAVPQASIAYRADVLREVLKLPAAAHVVCGIAFGWADEDQPANSYRTTRALLAEVVEFRDE